MKPQRFERLGDYFRIDPLSTLPPSHLEVFAQNSDRYSVAVELRNEVGRRPPNASSIWYIANAHLVYIRNAIRPGIIMSDHSQQRPRRSPRLHKHNKGLCSEPVRLGDEARASKRKAANDRETALPPSPEQEQPVRKKARLTTKNLRLHTNAFEDEQNGDDEPAMAPKRKKPNAADDQVKPSTTVTTTDPGFASQLLDNGVIYALKEAQQPIDGDVISARLLADRESPPPSPTFYDEFKEMYANPHHETKTVAAFWPMLSKRPTKRRDAYDSYYNHAWNAVDNLIITRNISNAKPDICEAFTLQEYPLKLRASLPNLVPSSNYNYLMPSFVVETKNSSNSCDSAGLQCAYDGALMVDSAMQALQHVKGDLNGFFGKTKAITVAFTGALLNVYAHHVRPVAPPDNDNDNVDDDNDDDDQVNEDFRLEFEYHQVCLHGITINGYKDLKQAYKVIRNAQDIGFDLASTLRKQLKRPKRATNEASREASRQQAATPAQHGFTPSATRSLGSV